MSYDNPDPSQPCPKKGEVPAGGVLNVTVSFTWKVLIYISGVQWCKTPGEFAKGIQNLSCIQVVRLTALEQK